MKKRFLAGLCAVVLTAGITGCGMRSELDTLIGKETSSVTSVSDAGAEGQAVSDEQSSAEDYNETKGETLSSSQSSEESGNGGELIPAANQLEAPDVPFGKKFTGKVEENDSYGWYSFKTVGEGSYTATIVNLTSGGSEVRIELMDEDGNQIDYITASGNGVPATLYMSDLSENTVYYPVVAGEAGTEYAIYLTSPDADYDPYEELPKAEAGSVTPATNALGSEIVPQNEQTEGKIGRSGCSWYAFRTGSTEGAEYKISVINTEQDGSDTSIYVYDKFGKDYGNTTAVSNGPAATLTYNTLNIETVYFFSVNGDPDAEYSFKVTGDEEEADATAAGLQIAKETYADGVDRDGDGEVPTLDNVILEADAGTNQLNAPLLSIGTRYTGGFTEKKPFYWYAFQTEDVDNADYYFSFIETNRRGDDAELRIYDKDGNKLNNVIYSNQGDYVSSDGVVGTVNLNLEKNTIYYLEFLGNESVSYVFMIRTNADDTKNYTITGNVETINDASEPGNNQSSPAFLPLNTNVDRAVREGLDDWYLFTTADAQNIAYDISVVNETPNSDAIEFRVYDEYGNKINNVIYSNQGDYAYNDGLVKTITLDSLTPDTNYFIRVLGTKNTQYNMVVKADVPADESEDLTFVEPFSLDETQVRFVINSAEFADPEAAKAALKPVAEKILAHPEHKILIAGTTATWGSQAYVQDLSDRRAAAVKKLLVDDFSVPEDQLITVGLGYADDPFDRAADLNEDGKFIESEAKKNRRVVIVDADSDIAKQILGTADSNAD